MSSCYAWWNLSDCILNCGFYNFCAVKDQVDTVIKTCRMCFKVVFLIVSSLWAVALDGIKINVSLFMYELVLTEGA